MDINLLTKDEIIYELKLRNISKPENYVTTDLRKLLRKALSQNVPQNVTNLVGYLNIKDEVECLSTKVNACLELSKEINTESRPIDVARLQAKIKHVRSRINNVVKFKMSENEKVTCEKLIREIKTISDILTNLNYNVEALNQTIDQLNTTNLLEEEMCVEVNSEQEIVNLESKEQEVMNREANIVECKANVPNFDLNMYEKLPNPMLHYFQMLPQTCDGLDVKDLLDFLKVIIKIKKETMFADKMIVELMLSKVSGPLQRKMLENRNLNIDQLKSSLLNTFVPFNMKQNLILRHVHRPQAPNEMLSLYVEDVKCYNEILDCQFSEKQIVQLIKVGMRPVDRVNLALSSSIVNFTDLDNACIESQNVEYSNYVRNCVSNRNQIPKPIVKYEPEIARGNVKKCFICNKTGHIAKFCFRKNSKN